MEEKGEKIFEKNNGWFLGKNTKIFEKIPKLFFCYFEQQNKVTLSYNPKYNISMGPHGWQSIN